MKSWAAIAVLILLMVFVTANFSIQEGVTSEDSQELILNGGFETGNFDGWAADRTCEAKENEYPASPTHKGGYSARVGTANPNIGSSSLSQSILIPEKSKGIVTFWYRIGPKSKLDFLLKTEDGSIIEHWTFDEYPSWKYFSYEISPIYSGKLLTLVFEGRGFMEWVKEPTPTLTEKGWEMVMQPKRKNYYPYIDDVSVIVQSGNYEASLMILGLPTYLSTKVLIDSKEVDSLMGGGSKNFSFRFAELHDITIEKYVYENNKTRYICVTNSAGTDGSSSEIFEFSYILQHHLDVVSTHGFPEGSGWYDEGEKAVFSISPTESPEEGFQGLLGVKHIFHKWSGSTNINSPSGEVYVNSPKRVVAIWVTDYSNLFIILSVFCVITVAVIILHVFKRKRR